MWGIIPGGASTMTAISSDYGADMRIVALMQYLRVIVVVLSLAVSSHVFADSDLTPVMQRITWFPPLTSHLSYTLLIALTGWQLSRLIKLPSGRLLLPMLIAATLQGYDIMQVEMPQWLLVIIFALIGLSVGL